MTVNYEDYSDEEYLTASIETRKGWAEQTWFFDRAENDLVIGIKLDEPKLGIDYGREENNLKNTISLINPYGKISDNNNSVTYLSLDTSIATVDSSGKVTANKNKEGITYIKVTSKKSPHISEYVLIEVSIHITILEDKYNMERGKNYTH